MPLKLRPASFRTTSPNILIVNLITMLSRDLHASLSERRSALGAPGFEGRAVGLVFDSRDHEICQVAEFVCEDVEEPFFVVDDFFGEFDGGVVFLRYDRCGCGIREGCGRAGFGCFAAPVGAPGG